MRGDENAQERLVLEAYRDVRERRAFASDALARIFRRQRNVDRGSIAARLYGLVRLERRVDFALGGLTDDRARLIAADLLEARIDLDQARALMPSIDWRAVSRVDERIASIADEVQRFALTHSLPDHLAALFLEEFGASEAAAFAAASNRPAPQTVRAKGDRDVLARQLANEGITSRPTRYAARGLVIDPPVAIFSSAAFSRGELEVMDEGSQLVAELVAPPPSGLVADACAGAGGKSLAIATLLGGKGRVVAFDVFAHKLSELRRRARRAGASNVQAIHIADDRPLPDDLIGRCDRVLVDAPCSGLGVLRRNPEARWRIARDDLDQLPRVQAAIAEHMLPLVARGGRLIYATCTLRGAENETIVNNLLARHSDLERVRVAEIHGRAWSEAIAGDFALRVAPHSHGTDGFYATVLRRRRAQ